ncbi:unnamed protein product [Amaranthus hypochondriacus]
MKDVGQLIPGPIVLSLQQRSPSRMEAAASDGGQKGYATTRTLLVPDGMALNFFAPSVSNGIARANVDKVEVAKLKMKWRFSCAMFIVGFKASLATFTSFIKAKWPQLERSNSIFKITQGNIANHRSNPRQCKRLHAN